MNYAIINFKARTAKSLLKYVWLAYCLIFIVAAFPQGFDTIIAQTEDKSLMVWADNQAVQEYFGGADIASYASGGQHLVENPFEFRDTWYINLWAPGMFLLHGGLLLLDENTPVVLIMMLFSIFLWSFVFSKLCHILSNQLACNILVAFSTPMVCFLVPPFRIITLTSSALGAESYSIAAFALGFLFFIESYFSNNSRKLIILSGLFFAMAAYMKASFDIYMRIFVSLILLVFIAKYLYMSLLKRMQLVCFKSDDFNLFLKKSLLVFGVFFVVTLPWRIYHTVGWINADYMYAYIWMADEQLADFVVAGGANAAACKIKPDICKAFREDDIENNRNKKLWMESLISETKKIIITNPISWAYYKLPYLIKYWFKEGRENASINTIVINSIILALMLGVVIIALVVRSSVDMFCCLIIFTVLAGTIIPHFVMHFEARYLYALKIMTYIVFVVSLTNFIRHRKINKNNFIQRDPPQ